jgi:hypothetical protein
MQMAGVHSISLVQIVGVGTGVELTLKRAMVESGELDYVVPDFPKNGTDEEQRAHIEWQPVIYSRTKI